MSGSTAAPRLDAAVLDASERQSLVAIRSLARSGVRVAALGTSLDAPAAYSRWCTTAGVLPDPALDSGAFAKALFEWVHANAPRVLLPVSDGVIEALREHRGRFEARTQLALAAEAALEVATSKTRTLELARQLGVKVPRTVWLAPGDDLRAAVAEVGLPLVVKPARSWNQGRDRAVRLSPEAASSEPEAVAAARAMWEAGAEPSLQTWVPGRREAVSLMLAQGQVKARFAQVAERMFPPVGGSSVTRHSIPLPADSALAAERLALGCGLEGYCEIEFRRDREGAPLLMEINPRLSASVGIAVAAGVDFPWLVYRWALGEPIDPVLGYRTGLRMRWLGGDLRRLRAVLASPAPEGVGRMGELGKFLADFIRITRYDYLDPSDPRPGLVAATAFITGLATEIHETRLSKRGG